MDSSRWQKLCGDLRVAVSSEAPTLISGERETAGRLARLLHERRPREGTTSRFLVVAPHRLTEHLTRYAAGSRPSPHHECKPVPVTAGWTLFLEDVDQLTPADQARLVSFMDGIFASSSCVAVDLEQVALRVIATTTKDLVECAARARFSWELVYRLNVVHLVVPPCWNDHEELATVLAAKRLGAA